MKRALLCLVLIAAAALKVAAAEPLKVFVFTNEVPSGAVDEQLRARRESLQDFVRALSNPKYQSTVTLVNSRAGADLIVELVSRGETTTNAAASSTRGNTAEASRSSSVTKQFLEFRISSGQHTDNLTTTGQMPWPKMAERAADDLVKWMALPR
jgi:hypothetical protein